jgi:predicted nucleic acid-binding protein
LERDKIPRYVPDASVAVKWFVREEDSAKARRFKELFQEGRLDLEAPSLLLYEVASALRFHPVAKFNSAQLRTVMESLESLQITRDPSPREWTTAFTLSLENSISIYDAVYIGFVGQGNARMVTADSKLIARIHPAETKAKLASLTEVDLA